VTPTTPATDAAWDFVRSVLDDLADVVRADARDARERVEGYRVLARILALSSELSVDVDPDVPRVFAMTTPLRQVGGPNPDGEYDLCALAPGRAHRISGTRGTVAYLGFQVMAGTGLTPRRQAAYVGDHQLEVDADGRFALVIATEDPGDGSPWVPIPQDASAVVVRQYVADRAVEELATYEVTRLDAPGPVPALDDAAMAEQLTALGWTAVKLMTLHRSVLPELLDRPNELVTAEAAALGSENTTPDNLYMLGTFDLEDGQVLQLDVTPPPSRYWSVTLENIWHECLEPFRRTSSLTLAHVTPRPDGTVRLVVSGTDPGVPNWLDTGGRRRGFVTLRWLDHPTPPDVKTQVLPISEVIA
jgi:hypothetical protein